MTVLDRMPADDLATRITNGPTGYPGVDGDEEWAAEVRRLADLARRHAAGAQLSAAGHPGRRRPRR